MQQNFLLRKEQHKEILMFLKSKSRILHIIGIPGTGKTLVVKETLKKHEYSYINCLENTSAAIRKIVVIDEFDKFCELEPKQYQKILNSSKVNKIITISNNLLPKMDNVLIFPPYTTDEIFFILKKKRILPDAECRIIAKHCADGDLRKALNYEFSVNKSPQNIHLEILREVIDQHYENLYDEYVKRCCELKLKFVSKEDFEVLYDIVDEC